MRRICSLDGGGIRGSLTTCFLVELEKQLGKPCREVFDFVAGTSTGACIASGIAVGLPATQILSIYQNRCTEIFNHPAAEAWAMAAERGYMFDSANISKVLVSEFGASAGWKLNDCPIRVLFTAKGVNGHPWFMVKDGPKNAQTTGGLSLVECVTASASAPIYFSPCYINPAKILIGWAFDGGVGTTANPVYQACVEAFQYDDFDPAETLVISLGTGYTPDTQVNPPSGFLPVLEWTVSTLVDAPVDEQTQNAMRQWPGVVQRFNWPLVSTPTEADVASIPSLVEIGQKAAASMDWKAILKL
jgi:patatin-like phospholipase/acyl hydrolase